MKRHLYQVAFTSHAKGDESLLITFALEALAGWKRHDVVVTQVACDDVTPIPKHTERELT